MVTIPRTRARPVLFFGGPQQQIDPSTFDRCREWSLLISLNSKNSQGGSTAALTKEKAISVLPAIKELTTEELKMLKKVSGLGPYGMMMNWRINRMKPKAEQLYIHMGGVWIEAAAMAKKVSASMKEKISFASEVKESFKNYKSSGPVGDPVNCRSDIQDRFTSNTETGNDNASQPRKRSEKYKPFHDWFRSTISVLPPSISSSLQKLKDVQILDLAKRGYDIVKDELSSNPNKRRQMRCAGSSTFVSKEDISSRHDIVVVPSKQSQWSKKWEALKDKMRGHPVFKRISGLSEPVVTMSQDIAEDMRERWETSDNPVVHKIQDINEALLGETNTALSFKEIRRRDPGFSLPEFVAEVQEMIKPTLTAYIKGDIDALRTHSTWEVIERCKAEHKAYESSGIFPDNKILHISDVEMRETKLMGEHPIIIVAFQTQQIYCVRDRQGSVAAGGEDTIHTVYYAWAMQLVDTEELGEGAVYPCWKLREMQQLGVQALI